MILLQNRFGDVLGERVWESCNAVFDRLPLAGVIDQDIFCVHGGIPRPLADSNSRIQVGFLGWLRIGDAREVRPEEPGPLKKEL